MEQTNNVDFAKYAYESAKLTSFSKVYKYQLNEKISDLVCRLSTNIIYRPYDRDKLMEMSSDFHTSLPLALDRREKYIYYVYRNQDSALKNLIYSIIFMNMASVRCKLVVAYYADEEDNEDILKGFIDLTNIGDLLSLNCIRFLRLDGIDEGSLGVVINNAFIAVDRVAQKGEDLGDDFEEIALPKLENNTSKANKSVIYQPIEDGIVKNAVSAVLTAMEITL